MSTTHEASPSRQARPSQASLQNLYEAMRRPDDQLGPKAVDGDYGAVLMVEALRFPQPTYSRLTDDLHVGTVITHEVDAQKGIVARRHDLYWRPGSGYALWGIDPPEGWTGYSEFDVQQIIGCLASTASQ